jgi:pSer/pThr/pTyr-binding forkhead associated (FHA) protein
MAFLKVETGDLNQQTYELCDAEVLIGRSPCCQIRIDSCVVPRRHAVVLRGYALILRGPADVMRGPIVEGMPRVARILTDDGTYHLHDLDSRTGTFLNGERLSCLKSRELRDGDLIQIAKTTLSFHQETPAQ